MVNTIHMHSMQILNMFDSCTDTTGPCITPFITCSYKTVKASIESWIFTQNQFMSIFVAIDLVWIATNQTIGTNVKRSCLIIIKNDSTLFYQVGNRNNWHIVQYRISEYHLHMLGDIIYFVSYHLEQSSCNVVVKHIIMYGRFWG